MLVLSTAFLWQQLIKWIACRCCFFLLVPLFLLLLLLFLSLSASNSIQFKSLYSHFCWCFFYCASHFFLFRAVRRSRWFWSMNILYLDAIVCMWFEATRFLSLAACYFCCFVHQLDWSTFDQSIERHKYKSNCAARDDGYGCNSDQRSSHSIAVYYILQLKSRMVFCAVRRVCRQYWTWFNRHVLIISTKLADGFIFHLMLITTLIKYKFLCNSIPFLDGCRLWLDSRTVLFFSPAICKWKKSERKRKEIFFGCSSSVLIALSAYTTIQIKKSSAFKCLL